MQLSQLTQKLGRSSWNGYFLIHYLPFPTDACAHKYNCAFVCSASEIYKDKPEDVPRHCVSRCVCVCVCFNLDPQVRIQSIFFFYLVTNEASFSVQRKESTFKYHCNSGACLSASLLSHWEKTVYVASFIALASKQYSLQDRRTG